MKAVTPVVSIVIVTLNAAATLGRTLDSIAEQAGVDTSECEVLLIDGGSEDETVRLAEEHELAPRIVRQRDDGIYDAMNRGAALAGGRFLHFLNAGDSFTDPESLRRVLHVLRDHDPLWLVAGARNLGGGRHPARTIPSVPHVWGRHALGLQPHCHQACWFDREVYLRSGGHSLTYGTAGDFDIILRWGLLAAPMSLPTVVIDYLGGGISERTRDQSPALLHRSRRERFGLGPTGRVLDRLISQLVHLRNTLRIRAGRLRQAARRSPKRRPS